MLIFFDTETTGIPPKNVHYSVGYDRFPHIVQIAWMICDKKGQEIERCNEIVKPDGYIIPIEATKIHRISTSKATKEGIPIKKAMKHFVLACEKCEKIVAHNIYFDMSIVKASLLRLGLDLTLPNHVLHKSKRVDTMRSTTEYCALPSPYAGYKWPKLEELHVKLFNEEMIDAHDAIVDVEYTKKCYFELINKGII